MRPPVAATNAPNAAAAPEDGGFAEAGAAGTLHFVDQGYLGTNGRGEASACFSSRWAEYRLPTPC